MAEESNSMSLLKVQTIIPRLNNGISPQKPRRPWLSFFTQSANHKKEESRPNVLPIERSGHRIVATNNHIFVIGGFNPLYRELFNEVWSFNISTSKWKKLTITGEAPTQVASHSMCLLGNCIIVFGGSGLPFGRNSSNDIYELDLLKKKWQLIPCHALNGDENNVPSKRYGHTMHPVGQYIYICGGTEGTIYMLDLYRLEVKSRTWEYIKCKDPPEPRYRHETVFIDNKLYLFGGGTNYTVFDLVKIPVLDFETFSWSYITCGGGIKNELPLDRKCHSCIHYKNYVYVCGGINGENVLNDVWRFSLKHHKWSYLGKLPQDVYFHSSAISLHSCMYLFGGVTKNEERINTLFKIQLDVPSLQEMCWRYICDCWTHLYSHTASELQEMGIPTHMIKRLSNCL
ncbi:kelch domain-containing protein 10-like isoform X2 [Argonauta hians]